MSEEKIRRLAAGWRDQAVRLRQHQHPSPSDATWCRTVSDTLDGCADDLEAAMSTGNCEHRTNKVAP